jgi:hypothetical protein
VSKWYLLIGSIDAGTAIFAGVLFLSGLLNIGYFWPVVYQAFFQMPDDSDAKPLVEFPLGGQRLRADGGEPVDRDDDDDVTDGDDSDDLIDSVGSEPSDDADGRHDPIEADPAEDPDADVDPSAFIDTTPTEGTVAPDIDPSEGESQVEIEAKVEGEYAVDKHPSDHLRDDGADDGDDAASSAPGAVPETEHHDDHDHHGGAPAGGWEARAFGAETTWFMLGPITVAAAGAVALGIFPRAMVFLAVIQRVVFEVTGVVV